MIRYTNKDGTLAGCPTKKAHIECTCKDCEINPHNPHAPYDMCELAEDMIARLAELENELESGKYVELPCGIGYTYYHIENGKVVSAKIKTLPEALRCTATYLEGGNCYFQPSAAMSMIYGCRLPITDDDMNYMDWDIKKLYTKK